MDNPISRWKRKAVINYLKKTHPDKLLKSGEDKLIAVFQDAASRVPAYKQFLQEQKVDIAQIKDKDSFKRSVPVVDKTIFSKNEIAALCKDGVLNKAKQISVSSGFSGEFSYALTDKAELYELNFLCDTLLDNTFNICGRRTFLINALGMGVRIYTDLPLAETSVRTDSVLALIKKFSSRFEQIILIGSAYFMKEVIEQGVDEGIDWKSKVIHLIIGEDWFPEEFRSYLAQLLGVDLDAKGSALIGSSMGICELGLSLFQESRESIQIRRLAQKDYKLRNAIFGEAEDICPILFHYNPLQVFLEEVEGNLIFTTLNRSAIIPLIRYASKDKGKIHSYNKIRDILESFGYKNYIPDLKLPLVSVMGRAGQSINFGSVSITPEQVKCALYSDFETAGATTGYFRMSSSENNLKLEIQLRQKMQASDSLRQKFLDTLSRYVKTGLELQLYPYKDFPYGMGLVYEHKFKYI